MKTLTCLLCLLSLTAISCDYDAYEIKMTPQGDTMVREVAVMRATKDQSPQPASGPAPSAPATAASAPASQPQVSPEALARLTKAYGSEGKRVDEKHVFTGRFKGKMPDDVGNSGTYTVVATEMGTTYVYLERFRGQENPGRNQADMQQAADRVLDLVIGWFESELGKEKDWPALKSYLDRDVRRMHRDLLAFYVVAAADLQSDKVNQELAARAAQYAIEHEMLTPQDLAAILGGPNMPLSERGMKKVLELARQKTAAKLGLEIGKPQPALAFLDWDKAGESFHKYVETTHAFKDFVAETKKKQATQPATGAASQPAEPTVDTFIGELVKPILPHWGSDTDDHLTVHLALPREPVSTNGTWEKDKKSVQWQFALSGTDTPRWPRIAYAVWVEPDEAFQKKHFGAVVLDGDELRTYCLTRKGMSAEESGKWMEALGNMSPANAMVKPPGKELLDALDKSINPPASQPANP